MESGTITPSGAFDFKPMKTKSAKAPTIRSIEKRKRDGLKKVQKGTKSLELDILTSPGKPIASVPRLKQKLDEFFSIHADDNYVTVNELAVYLGYADDHALMKDLFDDSNPKYTALLRRAYGLVDDLMTKRMLYVADRRSDVKGYQYALERNDEKLARFDPDNDKNKASVSIAIEMKETEEIRDMVSSRISDLLSAAKGEAIDVVPKKDNEPALIPAIAVSKEDENER